MSLVLSPLLQFLVILGKPYIGGVNAGSECTFYSCPVFIVIVVVVTSPTHLKYPAPLYSMSCECSFHGVFFVSCDMKVIP